MKETAAAAAATVVVVVAEGNDKDEGEGEEGREEGREARADEFERNGDNGIVRITPKKEEFGGRVV